MESDIAPELAIELNEMFYNCSQCNSIIEILELNEETNTIKFRCLNKSCPGKKIMSIHEYLEKMEKFRKNEVNKDKCKTHKNNQFISYCFDCNKHLCECCLKDRTHFFHDKNNNIEIQLSKEEINIIEEIIKNYSKKIEILENKKFKYHSLKQKLKNKINEKIQAEEKNELKEIKEKYNDELSKIKKKYEDEKKLKTEELKLKEINIIKKYKLLKEKANTISKINEELIEKKCLEETKNLNKLYDIKRLTEIIFNTYDSYSNNYFNILNINNLILSYSKNEKLKNEIMKKIIKNDLEEKLKNNEIITFIHKQELKERKEKEQKDKIYKEYLYHLDLKYKENIKLIKSEYENQIKKIKKEKEEINKKYLEYKIEVKDKINKINNQIIITYKINRNKSFIRIFGDEFVKNNKNICKIIINDEEAELQEKIDIQNLDNRSEVLKIKLKDIQNIINLRGMFCNCSELLCISDLSKLNTSKITNMSYLFNGCTSLEYLSGISNWDTSNVTDMSYIFNSCTSLISLYDISQWDTSKVTNMNCMFYGCESLANIGDISKWNTSNVSYMANMFRKCSSLKYLPDIGKWNTSNVNIMNCMFAQCSSLINFPDISNWNTDKLTNKEYMFYGCNENLNIPQKFNS